MKMPMARVAMAASQKAKRDMLQGRAMGAFLVELGGNVQL